MNRFKDKCPICRVGRNNKAYGGNKKCFHCGTCGFTECEVFDPRYENPVEAAMDDLMKTTRRRLKEFMVNPSSLILSGVMMLQHLEWMENKTKRK